MATAAWSDEVMYGMPGEVAGTGGGDGPVENDGSKEFLSVRMRSEICNMKPRLAKSQFKRYLSLPKHAQGL